MTKQDFSTILTTTEPYAEGIDDAGVEIMRLHYMVQKCAQNAIDYAIKAGRKLIERKKETPHGKWLPYVESLHISRQTSAGYMRLAESNVQGLVHLGIEEALKYLATPKEKKKPADLLTPHQEVPALSEDDKKIIAESDARIGKMIVEFVKERQEATQRSIDNKLYEATDPGWIAINLGLEILASLRELWDEIERKKVTPRMMPEHLDKTKQYLVKITKTIEQIGV